MTTIREQLQRACEQTGDDINTIVCFYQKMRGQRHDIDGNWVSIFDRNAKRPPVERGNVDDLPSFDYHAVCGDDEGPPFLGFSARYVYVHVRYDGAEWIDAVPRNPENVGTGDLPWLGGGG